MTRALLIALALALLTLTLFAGDAGDYSRQWKLTLTPCACLVIMIWEGKR